VKELRIAFSDAAIADILEQSDWYEAQADVPDGELHDLKNEHLGAS
jgi:hypothetical protein